MGAVYVVRQRSTGWPRALKLMHPGLLRDAASRQRFEQEASIGSRIPSDHVVKVVAAGIDAATGTPWLAMELLEGETLEACARRGPMTPRELLAIFEQLCHALAAAHRQGIVHRDLKPENVFLARTQTMGMPFVVKVLDFGIAKIREAAQTALTAPLGTPLYMAPEQYAGSGIDLPTDVWALGLIAFYLLTGNLYWLTPRRASASAHQMMYEVCHEPIVAASARAAQLGTVALPDGFDGWFSRCVAPHPSQRFSHAGEAMDALRAVLSPATDPRLAGAFLATSPAPSSMLAANGRGFPGPPAGMSTSGGAYVSGDISPSAPLRRTAAKRRHLWVALAAGIGMTALLATAGVIAWPRRGSVEGLEKACRAGVPKACTLAGNLYAIGTDHAGDPPLLHKACDTGNLAACTSLAWVYRSGTGVVRDDATSAALLAQACDRGVALACYELGSAGDGSVRAGSAVSTQSSAPSTAPWKNACDGLKMWGCRRVSEMLEALGTSLVRDDARAATYYQAGCAHGDSAACHSLGTHYDTGRGVPKDEDRAVSLYQKACDDGNGSACGDLGQMHSLGRGATKDEAKAVSFFQRGCDAGDAVACNALAVAYKQGKGTARDEAKALGLFQSSCAQGFRYACNNVGLAFDTGKGAAKDEPRAVVAYERACTLGSLWACHNLALMLERGRGAPKDEKRVVALHRRACDGGNGVGCSSLAAMTEEGRTVPRDPVAAAALYQRGCDGGDLAGCTSLGSMYDKGRGVAKDDVVAATLYQKACAGGNFAGCANAGSFAATGRGGVKDDAKALSYYQKACDGGNLEGCSGLGVAYAHGAGVPIDSARAAASFQRACDGNLLSGCSELGALYEHGLGVTKDATRAATLYQKACDGGVKDACTRRHELEPRVGPVRR